MSAFVVSTDTIDFLVAAFAKFAYSGESVHAPAPATTDPMMLAAMPVRYDGNTYSISWHDYDTLGAILLAQNIRSVNARYRLTDAFPGYTYKTVDFSTITPVAVLKSIACLRYQSCESDDYDASFAELVLRQMEHAAIGALTGYTDAPWGWTRQPELTHG